MSFTRIRKNFNRILIQKLIVASLLISILSSFLAVSLKHITEHFESIFLSKTASHSLLFFVLPPIGFSVIYFLRRYLFRNKENKGIREIFEVTKSKNKKLPIYKIPSHFINGLFTVAFGGSTGIEVSTVVATVCYRGGSAQENQFVPKL
ncbi:MAG: hypothetical protein QM710_00265 [Flavobacterium sp.]